MKVRLIRFYGLDYIFRCVRCANLNIITRIGSSFRVIFVQMIAYVAVGILTGSSVIEEVGS